MKEYIYTHIHIHTYQHEKYGISGVHEKNEVCSGYQVYTSRVLTQKLFR